MTIRSILIAPHPILRKKAAQITLFDAELHSLVEDMLETMYDAPGIGLAAPQVGVSQQVLVMDCGDKPEADQETQNPIVMVNPHVREQSGEREPYDEGCLSLPGYEVTVERQCQITVDYQDRGGQKHSASFDGLEARCILHEIDHLNGVMIVDYTSRLARNRIFRELRNEKQKNA